MRLNNKIIWLASFPRSGNTFARNVLYDVYGLESTEVNQKVYAHSSTHHEYPVVKTHLQPQDMESFKHDDIIVCLVRDGRDALVSIAHHRANIIEPGSNILNNLELAVEAQKGSYFGGWDRNVAEWMKKAHVVIRFEDLIKDPIGQLEKIRPFFFSLPEPNLNKIPTFESQKKGNPKYGPPKKKKLFFRKGQIGDWRNTMPEILEQKFWSKARDVMQILGYQKDGSVSSFDWSEEKRALSHAAVKKRVTLKERLSALIKPSNTFLHFDSKSKIEMKPKLVYFKALMTPDPFYQLIQHSCSPNEIAILDADENLKIRLHHPNGRAIENPSDIKVLISRLSYFYFSMAINLSGHPYMLSGLINPIQHILLKYISLHTVDDPAQLANNEPFIAFSKAFVNRNMFSRVLSKFSHQLNLVWTPENYKSIVNQVCENLNWEYHAPSFQYVETSEELFESLSRYNKKDLDVYHHFLTQPVHHG